VTDPEVVLLIVTIQRKEAAAANSQLAVSAASAITMAGKIAEIVFVIARLSPQANLLAVDSIVL
jgi:hypothetical protein